MHRITRTSFTLGVALAAVIAGSSLAQNDPNSAPNPYREDTGWAKLEQGALAESLPTVEIPQGELGAGL